jgi:isoleucyl-tRNA synthetase
MPILAEALYQNLALSYTGAEEAAHAVPESVHMDDWPTYDSDQIDEDLNQDMRLVTQLASLGHSARSKAGIKVRQPLAQVDFSVGGYQESETLARFADLLADELNVKKVTALGSADEAVSYSLKPLPRQLGQKYKALFPKVAKAIQALDPEAAGPALLDGGTVQVEVDGKALAIQPEEVEVRAEARAGLVVSADGPYLAALHTDLTTELVQEGLGREFVRRVQDLRKQAGFDIADRIDMELQASEALVQAVRAHQEYIMGETLTVNLIFRSRPIAVEDEKQSEDQAAAGFEFDDQDGTILLTRRA